MLKHALHYLEKGFSVIPVSGNKNPLVKWQEFQKRKPTEQEVTQWWTDYPEANIGIVTGQISNISVIDIDAKSGGLDTLKTLNLPITWTVKTGGGGWHYYYKYNSNAPQGTALFQGVDGRNDGGYVVAPPSLHKSGKRYEWSFVDIEMQDFPDYLFHKKTLNNWKQIIKGANTGNRNNTATKICGKLMTIFNEEDWEECVWTQMKAWNLQNKPPIDEKELRNVYESIAKRAVNNPKTVQQKVDDTRFLSFTEVVNRGYKELQNTKEITSYGYDWLDERLTGIFPSELVVIGGESGSGKTTFATNIMYKISKKKKCGIYALEDRIEDYGIKALFFKVNELKQGTKYTWNNFRRNEIKDPKYPELLDRAKKELANDNIQFSEVKSLMSIEMLEKLIEMQAQQGIKFFLVDHLHYFDLNRGDKKKSDYVEETMVRLKTLLNRLGVSMLLVVHYRKLNGQKPTLDSFKDSISIVQNASYVINLWRDRSEGADPYETKFLIPKARNPNGEGTITVRFDTSTNDYEKLDKWKSGTYQPNQPINNSILDDIKF